jgi:hypothetical protein
MRPDCGTLGERQSDGAKTRAGKPCQTASAEPTSEKGEDMTAMQRFVLDENHDVIDKLNPTGPKGYCHEGEPEDEMYLREQILWQRLFKPVDDLIINRRSEEMLRDGTRYQPGNDEAHAISWTIYTTIQASHLNTLAPALAAQNRFGGTLKCPKTCVQKVTSLSLFCDDVERLLRDLYGDIDGAALERTMRSVLTVVQEFTHFVRLDLWREHNDAMNWDYIRGIGVPEGYGISGSDWRMGMRACDDLRRRAHEVSKNPSAFSKYTVEFATIRLGEFIKLDESEDAKLDESEAVPPF